MLTHFSSRYKIEVTILFVGWKSVLHFFKFVFDLLVRVHVQDPTISLLGLPRMSSQNHIDQSIFCRKKRKGCRIMVKLFFPNLPIYYVKSLSITEAASLTPTTTIVFEPYLIYLGSRSYGHCYFWAIILSKVGPGGWWFGSYIGTFHLKWAIVAIVLGSFPSVYHFI